MLYLEDYLEMIENLPIEMRDRFTEIREMDLQVQNAMDSIDDRMKTFFKKCGSAPSLKQEVKDEQFKILKESYKQALEDADEKVQLANQIYELLERHLRKLDQELSKFKMELEADSAGITEILEKRSLELDQQPRHANNHRAEKRKYISAFSNQSNHLGEKKTSTEKVLSSLAHEAAKETLASTRTNSAASSPAGSMFESGSSRQSASLGYNLAHVGAGSNAAIAAAASRAIGATLEMPHGRRTASLKASYEAVTKKVELTKDLLLSGQSASSGSSSVAAAEPTKSSRKKGSSQLQAVPAPEAPPLDLLPTEPAPEDGSPANWVVDPNEPRYCLCNEVSYGEMVGCDNDDCPIEWFHYGCVGLTQAPKGKWYCPQCREAMKRRGRR